MAITTGDQAKAAEVVAAIAERFGSGTYTGNDSANRAIPHGLGVTPKLVIILNTTAGTYHYFRIDAAVSYLYYALAGTFSRWSTTNPTITNFYVGNAGNYPQSANSNTVTYAWVAIG